MKSMQIHHHDYFHIHLMDEHEILLLHPSYYNFYLLLMYPSLILKLEFPLRRKH